MKRRKKEERPIPPRQGSPRPSPINQIDKRDSDREKVKRLVDRVQQSLRQMQKDRWPRDTKY